MPDLFVAPKKETETEEPKVSEPKTTLPNVVPPESKGGSLSAFMTYPDSVRFNTQEDEEQIVMLLRKHWITNIPWMLFSVILLLVPTVILPLLLTQKVLPPIPANLTLIISLFWYLCTTGFILVNFIGWYFNVYIVTNERIIDVDFYQLLYKRLASTRIAKIQDLSYKLGGVVRAIFDYGDVNIQTAGTEANFCFEAVPHPEQVVRAIGEMTEKSEENV
ncbi:MAG: PH domain-containing protein [Patescibacteria group bacterium]|nr:PH domain-containing protein [Patescibacteria group bacterium]MCL5095794.1 PH domain-containing protein [Patescibacteria group bacterium]